MFKNKLVLFTSIFFAVIAFSAIGFVIYGIAQDAIHPQPSEKDVAVAQEKIEKQTEDIDEVSGNIAGAHKMLNDLTGWGADGKFSSKKSVSWNSERVKFDNVRSYLTKAIPATKGDLHDDLRLARELNEVAIKTHDHEALIMAHRVMHDLDNAINGDTHDVTFNAARAGLGDGRKVPGYEKYATAHMKTIKVE
jgi:hypothetical protein